MSDTVPNLVERAAARLQNTGSSTEPRKPLPNDPPAASGPVSGPQSAPFAPLQARGPERQGHPANEPALRATISPTSLAAHGIVLPSDGFSRTVEEFRAIKRQVLSRAARNAREGAGRTASRIFLITSARPGEGKTFTAINLALALAFEKDTRVLLMDADAYRQSVTEFLGISAAAGWLDAATHPDLAVGDVVVGTNLPGLSVLPAGKERPEIPEIMASRKMAGLLERLIVDDPRRLIVIDSLPCLTSTEPGILAALAEQTLFVVAAHQTSRENVESALRLLGGSPSVSLVLNKAEPLLCEQFKGYGYAYADRR